VYNLDFPDEWNYDNNIKPLDLFSAPT